MESIRGDRDYKLLRESEREMRDYETAQTQWLMDELEKHIRLGKGSAFLIRIREMKKAQKREMQKV